MFSKDKKQYGPVIFDNLTLNSNMPRYYELPSLPQAIQDQLKINMTSNLEDLEAFIVSNARYERDMITSEILKVTTFSEFDDLYNRYNKVMLYIPDLPDLKQGI